MSSRGTCLQKSILRTVLDPENSRIIDLLIKNPDGLSTSELAGFLGVTDRTVRNRMRVLVERMYVVPVGTGPRDPYRKYVLAENY